MNNYRKSNRPIRLTEQDIHFLVEEAVKGYLVENGMDERLTGYLGGMFNRASNQVQNTTDNLRQSMNSRLAQAKEYGKRKLGQVKQGVQNYKMAGQVSSINQDAQKAINTAYTALENIKNLSLKLKNISGYSICGKKTIEAIDNCLIALKSDSGLNVSKRFAGQRDVAVDPNAEFAYRK